jgi:hypothetical protein
MGAMTEPQEPAYTGMNGKQVVFVILVNVLILAELTLSIYLGSRAGEDMTITFLLTFLPMVAGTMVLARMCLRRLASR